MIWLPYLLLSFAPHLSAESIDMPAQAARGKAIFFDAAKKTQCATCHELDKQGTSVGPDVAQLARLSPRAMVISILSTRTVHAKEIELKGNRKFPGMIKTEQGDQLKVYDLSEVPPVAMNLTKAEIHSIKDNATWKHPPESTGYTNEQLADVIAYIRFVAYGDTKGVSPSEVK